MELSFYCSMCICYSVNGYPRDFHKAHGLLYLLSELLRIICCTRMLLHTFSPSDCKERMKFIVYMWIFISVFRKPFSSVQNSLLYIKECAM